jgi:DNA-binding NarL/FixJ family response regulator
VILRVFVVDARPHAGGDLATGLSSLPEIRVIGEARSGAEAVAAVTVLRPDVVVLDVEPTGSSIPVTREIVLRRPGIAVLVLTRPERDESQFAVLRAGARGCLDADADHREIAAAVRTVADGEVLCDAEIAGNVLAWFASGGDPPQAPVPELADREQEILDLAARGLATPAIAHRLLLQEQTVRSHVANVFMKLQVADRSAAVARARSAGTGD